LLLPASALASTPFDGTWKVNLESIQVSGKPILAACRIDDFG